MDNKDIFNFMKFVIVCFTILTFGLVSVFFIFGYHWSISMAREPLQESITLENKGSGNILKSIKEQVNGENVNLSKDDAQR